MYEPSGGSAPDIAEKNVANPIAQILSGALMLDYSFGLIEERKLLEDSVQHVLHQGFRTSDIAAKHDPQAQPNETVLGTEEFGDQIVTAIETLHRS